MKARTTQTIALLAAAWLSLATPEQSQAQLLINVYPSQDNPSTQTLWIFSGSSTTSGASSIRSSGAYNPRDTALIASSSNSGNLYNANKPNNQIISLSPLSSSANAKDRAAVNARIPGGGKTDITFAANATNTPTITIGSGSRTIANLFMDDDVHIGSSRDGLGIRNQAPNLVYGNNAASSWVGAGLVNKPIGDFFAGTFNNSGLNLNASFAARSQGSVRITVTSSIIPEPQEYALVFGLFALAFVFFRRHRQRKRQQSLVG